jgi:4-amino-4-deoxy-L-arabinose transferase and related glycosyltransferases of PMT family
MQVAAFSKRFYYLLAVWFVINLLQSLFTNLHSDEAYYALYAQHMAWGYFDHPPMVAVLIKISSLLFHGNLGVRFMTVVLQLFTLMLTWRLIDDKVADDKKVTLFFILAASPFMFAVYGFITTPDAPLLFFTALFLYLYKQFLNDKSWKLVIFLGIAIAGLVYSKYQASLVVGFVLLSNLRLLWRGKAWAAIGIALLLVFPHIYWQIDNHFPSFQYHLVGRAGGFQWKFLLEYLPNQLAVFNPFVLGTVVYVLVKYRPTELFERALFFMIIGFIAFFWITGVRGHVEPHWTIACVIPMIILLYRKCQEDTGLQKYAYKVILPSLVLLLIARVALVTDLLPPKTGFGDKEKKVKAIESVAGDLPVIFTGSFQNPSEYIFYTHKPATVISSLDSRQSQFDIYQFEKKWNNKPAFICANVPGKSRHYKINGIEFDGFKTDSLQTVNRIKIDFALKQKDVQMGRLLILDCTFANMYNYDINFRHHQFSVKVQMALIQKKNVVLTPVKLLAPIKNIRSGETIHRYMLVRVPNVPHGEYSLGITLTTSLGAAMNGRFYKVTI